MSQKGARPAAELDAAVAWLRQGGIVVFPTETFYGLAVDPTQEEAVQSLLEVKGRPAAMAVPLIAASARQVEATCGPLGASSARLAETFWPGPLAVVLDAPPSIAPGVHGGLGTVAVRVPGHPFARALAASYGSMITATSANASGQTPAVTIADLGPWSRDARLFIIDGGRTTGGAPSTIVDVRHASPVLVREGAIAWDRVLESLK